jgi:alpha-1,4-digalacturonate transport system permease protein
LDILWLSVSWLFNYISASSVARDEFYKSQFLLQKYDTNFLPMDYERVARATTYGPDGKDILIMKDLEPWVMFWKNLDDEERAEKDVVSYIKNFTGNEYYALRSHFGLVSVFAKDLIAIKIYLNGLLNTPACFLVQKKIMTHSP